MPTKVMLIMRLTAILMITATLHVSANSFSQNVTISSRKITLEKAFKLIEDQTHFSFLWDENVLDKSHTISIQVTNAPLPEALDLCLKGLPLSYKIRDKIVLIQRINVSPSPDLPPIPPPPVEVHGKVTDENGKPLAGVSVMVAGTGKGVTTDSAGRYIINVPKGGVLNFSYVGFGNQKIVVDNRTSIDVKLVASASELNNLVIIGYGSVKRKEVTGAISTIKGDDLNTSANTSFEQALAGRAPGLLAVQSTGQPGADVNIRIRDNPSYASSGTLFVLDGVPINNAAYDPGNNPVYGSGGVSRSPMNFINPNDIESIEILKDASAASIYGAQAGAGVVLITTKRGKSDKPRLDYNFSQAFQKEAKFYDILGTKDYMSVRNQILHEMYLANHKISPYGNTDPTTVAAFTPKYSQQQIDTTAVQPDLLKSISRPGFVQQHNLSLSGGNAKTRYFISGNYINQQGVIRGSDLTRYNGRINIDQVVSNKIRLGVNIVTSNSGANNQAVQTSQNESGGIILAAMYYPANLPALNADGTYPLSPDYPNIPNPLSYLTVTDQTNDKRLLTSGFAEWEIISGLKAKANFSYDQSTEKRMVYMPTSFLYGQRAGGSASIGETNAATQLIDYTLAYSKNIGDHQKINAVAGYSYQVNNDDKFSAGNNNFLTDQFSFNNLSAGANPHPSVGSDKSRQVWASYFARAIYSLYDKYTISASIRRDGSSIFAENKKYGYFPSVSAAWMVSEEPFFESIHPVVNNLKFRASYGTTGNSNIGQNAFAYYGTGLNYVFGNTQATGVSLSQIANPNLTWETVRELNLGIDYDLLKGRISGSFDYFHKTISNLLTYIPLTTDYPVSSVASNAGETGSRGWEIGLHSRNIVNQGKSGFQWNTDLTLSHFYSFWIQRSPNNLKTLAKYIDPKGQFDNAAIYGYVSDGIYTGQKAAPAAMPGLIPGGLMVKDLNGYDASGNLTGKPDGQISSADMKYLGSSAPKVSLGFNNTFRYGNFDLSIYLYGSFGALKYNTDYEYAFGLQAHLAQFGWNTLNVVKDRWTSSNINAKWPSGLNTGYEAYTGSSSFWYEKADFIRCRDITLAYTVPASYLKQQNIFSGLRVSAGIQNVFVITGYKGIDPELQSFLAYPMTRSVIIGVNASF
ncbi:MAG TPA: TonB-dependent receptor [Puia sp.]|nr:TonB-dependent receptor [Puia sp.]